MKISPFEASYLDLQKIPHETAFFDTVKEQYLEYKTAGLFLHDPEEAIYLYRIESPERSYTGLVACADIEDYLKGLIKKHEHTIVKHEQTQLELLRQRAASIKPVLITYPRVDEIQEALVAYAKQHQPFQSVKLGSDNHVFWRLTKSPFLDRIIALFDKQVPIAYIADGHHRTATLAMLYKSGMPEASKLLCAFFQPDELEILGFHRVVEGLNGRTTDEFLEALKPLFVIKFLKKGMLPHRKLDIAACLSTGEWFSLQWRKSVVKAMEDANKIVFDAHLLNEKVLKPILGIKNIRRDNRVTYLKGTKDLLAIELAAKKLKEGVIFCLHPVYFEDMIALADSEGIMPPKSTFFAPRMLNGLLGYEI